MKNQKICNRLVKTLDSINDVNLNNTFELLGFLEYYTKDKAPHFNEKNRDERIHTFASQLKMKLKLIKEIIDTDDCDFDIDC